MKEMKEMKGSQMNDQTSTASIPFSLLAASPTGLVCCATDWLDQSRVGKRFDSSSAEFAAVGFALKAAPKAFIGASSEDWASGPRAQFWLNFFQASAANSPVVDFGKFLAALDKPDLAFGARNMLMIAAKAKDLNSFELLLATKAARRSKLLMFEAYRHGGRAIAELVKQPTSQEALELLENGGSCWRTSRRVEHDLDGIAWLVGKCETGIDPMFFAGIAATAKSQEVLEKGISVAIPKLACEDKLNGFGGVVKTREEREQEALLGMVLGGSPWFAKEFAISIGGESLWERLCKGEEVVCDDLHLLPRIDPGAPEERTGYFRIRGALGLQAACSLSRNEAACSWLIGAVKAAGGTWMGAQRLREKIVQSNIFMGTPEIAQKMTAAALSASERAEFSALINADVERVKHDEQESLLPAPKRNRL